jgi:hypothetical protein
VSAGAGAADPPGVPLRSPQAVAVLAAVLAAVVALQLVLRSGPAATAGPPGPVDGAVYRLADAEARAAGAAVLPRAVRDAPMRFAPSVHPADRALVLAAIEQARPEAKALVGAVDGLVDVEVGEAAPGAAGSTYLGGGSERFRVVLELGPIFRETGLRGVSRLVLHELGHVVDHALTPAALDAQLDAGVPPCAEGEAVCPREERFAESFAKWATGDIGLALPIGYSVPPPQPTPERWGEPLAALARAAG